MLAMLSRCADYKSRSRADLKIITMAIGCQNSCKTRALASQRVAQHQEDGEWAGVRAELPERRPRAADKFAPDKADIRVQAADIPRGAGPVRVHVRVYRAVIPAAFGQAS
ncbi:MAG: hypothetical protein EZS28_044708 [Streblomastix strix]|uniref:Uncharacterized protein n=1 Tax=Streblomastix strix TaxID=222440 RepID=A0A5J4TQZ5_9EUKA|nr:MAG: hypothetical protein EZS28_044708 [Streblomastix strix]